jgi:hypothetical protein
MAFFAKSEKKKVADQLSTLQIPEELVHAAAQGLADSLTTGETERNLLYPDVERVSFALSELSRVSSRRGFCSSLRASSSLPFFLESGC